MKEYSISFCTVSMNRLHHLKETIPANLDSNKEYRNLEFILLDYNSSDGMEEWVKTEMTEHLESGRLKYYRTNDPEFFNRSHSRNISFNLASNEIICNVDADNFTGDGFAAFLNEEFNKADGIIVNSNFHEEYFDYKDAFGRFGAWRKDFHAVGGYDESMTSYGYEDIDFYDRLVLLGRKEVKITNFDFLKSISHGYNERIEQEYFYKNLERFYVAYDIGSTKVIFLYKDGKFETGTLNEKEEFYPGLFTIHEGDWLKGTWQEDENHLLLSFAGGNKQNLFTDNNGLCYLLKTGDLKLSFFKIENRRFLENVINSYSLVTNVSRYKRNLNEKTVKVNPEGYGRAVVYKNFSEEPVHLTEPEAQTESSDLPTI